MTITPLPDPPSTSSPSDFDSKADAFVAALDTMVDEINNVLPTIDSAATSAAAASASATAAIAATTFVGTSAQSNTLTSGAGKNFSLVETGKGFAVNDHVTCIRRGNENARLRCTVTAFTAGSGAMTLTADSVPGDTTAGSFTDWIVMLSVFEPPLTAEIIAAAIGVSLVL